MLTGFLVTCPGSYNHLQGTKISFIYTYHLYINISAMESSLLVAVLGGICTCSFLRRNIQSLFFLFCFSPSGLLFKMQTGQQVAITVACSCEMMLVPVRSVLFYGFRNVCFFFSVQFMSVVIILTCPIANGQTSQKQDFKV